MTALMTPAAAHDLATSLRAQADTLRREADALESTASWAEHVGRIVTGGLHPAHAVPCPYCHAEAGQRCKVVEPYADWSYANRIYRDYIHQNRIDAAENGAPRTLEGLTWTSESLTC